MAPSPSEWCRRSTIQLFAFSTARRRMAWLPWRSHHLRRRSTLRKKLCQVNREELSLSRRNGYRLKALHNRRHVSILDPWWFLKLSTSPGRRKPLYEQCSSQQKQKYKAKFTRTFRCDRHPIKKNNSSQ